MPVIERRLIRQILLLHFGEVIEKIGSTVLVKGPSTFPNLLSWTNLPARTIKEALIVMIHHGILSFESKNEKGKMVSFYMLNKGTLLMRLRFPAIIVGAKQRYGPMASNIVREILKHGRYSIESFAKDDLKVFDVLNEMLKDKFIEYVPDKESEVEAEPEANSSTQKRKLVESGAAKKRANNPKFLQMNFLKCMIYLRDQAIITLTKRKFNQTCVSIIQSLLEFNETTMHWSSVTLSSPMTAVQLTHKLPKGIALPVEKRGCITEDLANLNEYIAFLTRSPSSFLIKTENQFYIDFKKATCLIQKDLIEAMILEKYSQHHVRLFNVLLSKQCLEDKHVSKLAMISLKDARSKLFHLFNGEYIQLQEVPKTADHAPSRTLFLWKADLNSSNLALSKLCRKEIVNLQDLYISESKIHEGLLAKLERADPAMLTPAENELAVRVKEALKRLEFEVLRMDYMLAMLQGFSIYTSHEKS